MSWRDFVSQIPRRPSEVSSDFSAPSTSFGSAAKPTLTVGSVPSAGGWRDHVARIRQVSDQISQHIGDTIASHLTDNPAHQNIISEAVKKFSLR